MRVKAIVASLVAVLVLASFFALQLVDEPSSYVSMAYAQEKMVRKPEAEKKLADIRKQMASAKRELMAAGKYNCCIRPSCDFCALSAGKCPCALNLADGKPVCGTCAGGWAAGYGQVPDIDPATVKAISGETAKMMYGMRAKAYGVKEKKK